MDKKSNPRKFKIWDSKILHDSLQFCVEYQSLVEQTIKNKSVELSKKDTLLSTVPTETLYDLVNCYIVMYQKLLNEDLIQSNSDPASSNKKYIH